MRTYRELFRTPQFGPLFATSAVQVAASTMSGLALGTLVYAATDSPLLAALSMFGSSLAQVIGATVLMSAADRLPPRAAMTGMALAFGLATATLAVPGLPLTVVFAIVLTEGVVAAVGGGVRYGLLNEVLPKDGYLLGRSVLNMCVGLMQIGGFALGGLLVTTLSARGTLLVAAALYLTGAAVARFGLARRPPRAAGRPSVAETWRTNAVLWSSGPRRRVYLALWVPNGLIVGCESLFVPYAPDHAGLLFACAALGMLIGDTVAGRFVAQRRMGAAGHADAAAPGGPVSVLRRASGAAARIRAGRARLGRVLGESAAPGAATGPDPGRDHRSGPRTALLRHAHHAGRRSRARGRRRPADLTGDGDDRDGGDLARGHPGPGRGRAPNPEPVEGGPVPQQGVNAT